MDPMLEEFEQVVSQLQLVAPTIPLISNLTGRVVEASEITKASYWVRQTRETVQFESGIQELAAQGCEIFLELGPKPVLARLARRCLPQATLAAVPSLQAGVPDWQILLETVSTLHLHGVEIDWKGFDSCYERHKLALPTYPFERQRYWVGTSGPQAHQLKESHHVEPPHGTRHPLLGKQLRRHLD
jgi:acyl transferase domain-containing protein